VSDLFEKIVSDVKAERERQDARWGKQLHPNGTSIKFKPLADAARNACRAADANGMNTWGHIAREEFWEVMSETSREGLRAELVQLVAVGVAWIECLDEQSS
jgi:hypothetical protein